MLYVIVAVSSGSSDSTTDYSFFTVLETKESKIKLPVDLVSGESLISGLQIATFSLYLYLA
jgi:hypothetical protein